MWTIDGWEKQSTRHLYTPGGRVHAPYSETHVQFHQDQIHLLVVHETQIAIFQAPRMDCLKQVCILILNESSGESCLFF